MSISQITITAGHNNDDPGAVNGQYHEAVIVADFRNMVTLYIERDSDIKVLTDGIGTDNAPLSRAIALAQKSKLAIEFHLNSSDKPSAKGVEALADPKHKALCQLLCKKTAEILNTVTRGGNDGFKNEGDGAHSRLGFISKGGGIIFELFFLSNPTEFKTYHEVKWILARELSKIIIEYCK